MNKYMYIDTENVGLKFIDILKDMDESWTAYIFFTEHTPRVPFDVLNSIKKLNCNLEFIKCYNGTPNALDFSLVLRLGMSIKQKSKSYHIVVSDDKGFDASLKMLNELKYKVCRYSVLNGFVTFSEMNKELESIKNKFEESKLNNTIVQGINIHSILEIELRKLGISSEEMNILKPKLEVAISKNVLIWDLLVSEIENFEPFKGSLGKSHCNTLKQRVTNKLQSYGYIIE